METNLLTLLEQIKHNSGSNSFAYFFATILIFWAPSIMSFVRSSLNARALKQLKIEQAADREETRIIRQTPSEANAKEMKEILAYVRKMNRKGENEE